ncbi:MULTISPECIES: hypothetical protein [unclassified Brevundimonas]|uniref:hypothetical protein n=1 Tax=unclassified Brevundimonas TaxID=2622653 RepID=UPI000CFBF495|nr:MULTISPECIES: hypothetical protein [unclassified Brevundimonas]PRA29976.1 hypothetical protein CQ024_08275 [Brevundimonas sp. MYb27]PQZ80866.1 hypothetical protein CQ026_10755 [Brevundimonas sp. MYb31]PRB14033.1 hypothetical protein CQ039_11040 [Brevundimonas sp. MYb52]PRB33298.1 hypothetical protein CQ035_13610 [Brevundimonas sp. MYb46]PRB50790.1 hypothetical protein CQ028_07325 [Brevundimonas sp. MYb33]
MSAIERPTPRQQTRRLVVLAAAVFAVVVPIVQNLGGFGLSQAEFAAEGNQTLQVAGYAFSIWGLIYLGLLAYAVRQALPQTGESVLINRMGWPSAVAFFGIGMWIIAAALNLKAASVVIIFASLLALLVPLLVNARTIRTTGVMDRDRWFLIWPLAALAGWLTVAAPLNLITTATAFDALPAFLSPTVWAIAIPAFAVLVGLEVTHYLRTLAYPLPIAWGLVGIFVAEQERNPTVAYPSLVAAFILVVVVVVVTFGLKRGIERPH